MCHKNTLVYKQASFKKVKSIWLTRTLINTKQGTCQLCNKAQQMLNLMEGLEDNEDVSHVYANFDISDEVLEALS